MGGHADGDEKDVDLASTTLADEEPPARSYGVESLAPGVVLNGTYALERRLGEGGMGEVWQAKHLRLPKSVAIKVLLPSLEASPEVLERFKREAEIGATLAHPNIVHVFDFNELEDGRKYIAMELLEGESLSDRLERGALPRAEVAAILEQAGLGLRVAHDAGVVHRDLKPDNIFLAREPNSDPPYRVKILDFGISKIQRADTALTRDMTVMGTPAYMAPEQAMGFTNKLGPRADQFALATIAYEMLTGEVAFRGNTLAEIVYRVVQETPPPLETLVSGVSARSARAIAKAMAKEPDERFTDITAFVSAFVDDDAGQVEHAATQVAVPPRDLPRTASTEPATGRVPSHRWWLAGAGGALVVAIVAVFAWSSGSGDGESASREPATRVEPTRPSGSSPPSPPAPDEAPDEPTEAPTVTADPDSEQATAIADDVDTDQATPEAAPQRRRDRRADSAALGPLAQDLLDQANAALTAGDARRAGALAERSFRTERNQPALEVMAMAACQQRDLGLANARLNRLRGAARRRIRQYCTRFGLTPHA